MASSSDDDDMSSDVCSDDDRRVSSSLGARDRYLRVVSAFARHSPPL